METFEEYCAARIGRDPVPALDPATLQQEARHVLGYYGKPGGYMPGSFTSALIRCWELADSTNRDKLADKWPELDTAIFFKRTGNYEGLLALAEGRTP